MTNEGVAFRESTIGKRLTAFVAKCGINLGGRMAFVDMRKVITTEMLKRASPEEREILRRVLAHSEKTSKQWYSRPDLTDTGIQAVRIIERLLEPTEKAKFVDRPGTSTSTSTVTKPEEPKKPQPPSSSGVVPPSEHSGLTKMQKEELMNVFREDIHAGRPVKASQVRERIKVIKILSVLTTSDQRMKSVRNYLNYEARKYALAQSEGSSPPASVAPADDSVQLAGQVRPTLNPHYKC